MEKVILSLRIVLQSRKGAKIYKPCKNTEVAFVSASTVHTPM
jgi:hypothetical protein